MDERPFLYGGYIEKVLSCRGEDGSAINGEDADARRGARMAVKDAIEAPSEKAP